MDLCIFLVLLLISCLGDGSVQAGCKFEGRTHESYSSEGDILIGGVFAVNSGFTFSELTLQEAPQPVHCEGFNIRYYRDVLAVVFAIKEINKNAELLPNITLGFRIFDSCMSESRAIERVLELISGTRRLALGYRCPTQPPLAGIVGELFSFLSVPMGRILGVLHYPQISHSAMLSSLSDKLQFPSFLRTMPAFTSQNTAFARLAGHFEWTWLGMIVSDDEVGLQGGHGIRKSIEENGGCLAFVVQINFRYSVQKVLQVAEMIQRHAVKVIIVHGPEVHVKVLMQIFYELNVTSKVWVFSAACTINAGLLQNDAWRIFHGSLGIFPHPDLIPGFEEFLHNLQPNMYHDDMFIKLFWEKVFHCIYPNSNRTEKVPTEGMANRLVPCTGDEKLGALTGSVFEFNDLSFSYHAYLAVYAFAHTLAALTSCMPGRGPFINSSCANIDDIKPWQILHYLKNIHFNTFTGEEIFFDSNGDPPAAYDIMNMQISEDGNFQLVKVGQLNPMSQKGKEIIAMTSTILWSDGTFQVPRSVCSESCPPGYRRAAREGQPACCFDCVPCSQGEVSNGTDTDKCLKCPDSQWPNGRRDRCIPKVIEFLTSEEPLGLTLTVSATFLTLFTAVVLGIFIKYRDTPIVKANNRVVSFLLLSALMFCFLCSFIFIGCPTELNCMLRQTVFAVVFTVSVSSVLAKTIIVVLAFKMTNPSSSARKWLGTKTPSCIVFSCSLVQILLCVVWIVKSPPFPELNMTAFNEKIIFECNEGEHLFFYCMLGYMGLLATVSFIVAFLSRNLPGSFNEAKLITFSMLVFVSVWISFIPAYLSTRGKYMVAVEVFAILCSGAGLLGCIFFPKCYIILVRPQKNAKEHLVGKYNCGSK